jgi:hypothetical protein
MIIAIEKSALRRKMLQACIEKQQSLINDFEDRVNAIIETPGLGNEEEYDNNVLSHQSQYGYEIESLRSALKLVTEEMNTLLHLESIAETIHTVAEPGAIVFTNKGTFFVAVSVNQFEVDGDIYIGVSAQSPLYQAMKGLAKGKDFRCSGIAYKILDIF